MSNPLGELWITAIIDTARSNKQLADGAIVQLSDEQLRQSLDAETNSVAVVMKHVAGNLRSRWTDFLTTDGEKLARERDQEFVDDYADRAAILADWKTGWEVLFDELGRLECDDLLREVTIRGHRLSVPQAICRSISHSAYHVGQIVQTARILTGERWQTLTIPRGHSEQYNREQWGNR